ncbi:MAG: phosphoribosylanthranilate isomerase [Flavobacteriaceae bacterium]|nr:phosphoribosylanthranilate isomerase [Flavobacteriaceae bacterium]
MVKLKICGMKYHDNILEAASLQPEYMGFIFYPGSKRFLSGKIPDISEKIKKTGVFVNQPIDEVIQRIKEFKLDAVQLHGDETVLYCTELLIELEPLKKGDKKLEVIKAFAIEENFDFDTLEPYKEACDFFLFDSKGKARGGNGMVFNWEILRNYTQKKPYFLSGGIGLEASESLQFFLASESGKKCYALDINSRFEIEPGRKDLEKLKVFGRNSFFNNE